MRGPLKMRERLCHLVVGLAISCALAPVAAVVGYLVGQGTGAAGAVAGVGVVAASYSVSSVAVAWADSVNVKLIMPVGLAVYVVKIAVIGVVMWVIAAGGWPGLKPMGGGVVAAVVAWCAGQIWWVVHQQRAKAKACADENHGGPAHSSAAGASANLSVG